MIVSPFYGTWISPAGVVSFVKEMCAHLRALDYGDADDEGWIATIERYKHDEMTPFFCARYNRENVTKEALVVLLERYKNHPLDHQLIAEGIYQKPIYFGMETPTTKKRGIAFIRNEIKAKITDSKVQEDK